MHIYKRHTYTYIYRYTLPRAAVKRCRSRMRNCGCHSVDSKRHTPPHASPDQHRIMAFGSEHLPEHLQRQLIGLSL